MGKRKSEDVATQNMPFEYNFGPPGYLTYLFLEKLWDLKFLYMALWAGFHKDIVGA